MVTAFYKVFNEADFLKASLDSIYNHVDRIVIFEYCLQSMRDIILDDRISDRGQSVDGTVEIIENYPDPQRKIEYKPLGVLPCDEEVPYQIIVDNIDVRDYAWVIDGDIVYPEPFARKLKAMVDSDSYDVIWVPEIVFWHDLSHIKSNYTAHHQRIFRKQTNLSFYLPGSFEVWWFDQETGLHCYKRPPSKQQFYKNKILTAKWCDEARDGFAYHYSYTRPLQKILEKLLWQYNMIDRKWDNVPTRNHASEFNDPLDFKLNTMDWFVNKEFSENIKRWTLGHPKTMDGNKWFDVDWDEQPIIVPYEEARKLVKNTGDI